MRVLVTGGSGFIGSHVVDRLRAAGHEPVIFDLRPSRWHSAEDVECVLGDITDRASVEAGLIGCDAVCHLAAVADVNDVLTAPESADQINTHGTVTVLEAARRAGVERVVYASTIWVYSDCVPESVDEDTPIEPPSHLYTATKFAGELYCKSYAKLYGIDYTIMRFGIPYGPRAREAAVVPAFVGKALRGEPLTIAGDGAQSRRFVYVEDLAEGVVRGLRPGAAGRVYNLTGEETVTIKQIAETVRELIGSTEIVYTPARTGDFGGKLVCSKRAARELDWHAETLFQEGVRRYVAWRLSELERVPVPAVALAVNGNGHAPSTNGAVALVAPVAGAVPALLAAAAAAPAANPAPAAAPPLAPTPARAPAPAAVATSAAPTTATAPRVLILSADIGAGHDLPAAALVRELETESPGAHVTIVNGLVAMSALLTHLFREGSAFTFRHAPWMFDVQYWLVTAFAPTRWLSGRLLSRLGRRGLLRLIRAHAPDIVISTYPGTTWVLGDLRARGKVKVPCYSSITDLSGLRYWAHPGIDMHFLTHPESVEEVERIAGPGSTRWTLPPVSSPDFYAPCPQDTARAALGLPASGKLVAISGGGWGIGDLEGAVRATLDSTQAHVLCLCGQNERVRAQLAERFAEEPRLTLLGFTDRMNEVLAAADALVHSTAGLTVLEAHMRGCPVISYGFGVGHIRANNRAFKRFGLAEVARRPAELAGALERALISRPQPEEQFARRPTSASVLLQDPERPRRTRSPAWRRVTARLAPALVMLTLVGGWAVSTDDAFALISQLFGGMRPTTAVATHRPQVGVIVMAPIGVMPDVARQLEREGVRVSFAVDQMPTSAALNAVNTSGDETLPELRPGGFPRWLGTKGQLRRINRRIGTSRHFVYVLPRKGFNLGQYWFAHSVGGRPVSGSVRVHNVGEIGALRAGEIIEIEVSTSGPETAALAHALAVQLRERRLAGVPIRDLMND